MSKIGEEVSEKIDIIPAKIQGIRHIRYKYACKNCEGVESEESAVKIAPPPSIPKWKKCSRRSVVWVDHIAQGSC